MILDKVGDKISLVETLRRLKPRGLRLDLIVIQVDELSDPLTSTMLNGCTVLYDGLKIKNRLSTL